MFSKVEVIDMMLSEYDETTKNFMKDKLATYPIEKFNSMVKQMGLVELSKGYYTFKI